MQSLSTCATGSKHVVTIEADLVQHGGVRSPTPVGFVPFRNDLHRPCSHDGNASQWADIGLSADLHRAVFDQDVGPGHGRGGFRIGLVSEAKDGAALGIDANLTVIAKIALKRFGAVPVGKAAEPLDAE